MELLDQNSGVLCHISDQDRSVQILVKSQPTGSDEGTCLDHRSRLQAKTLTKHGCPALILPIESILTCTCLIHLKTEHFFFTNLIRPLKASETKP